MAEPIIPRVIGIMGIMQGEKLARNPAKKLTPKPKKGELHYRKGQIDEWKTIFTDEQIEKASKMMSKNMKKQFAWPD